MKTDTQIRRDVLDELTWDTRVTATDVGVAVTSGVVTLTGDVGSWTARLAAQEAAHRVNGVLDVANEIRVTPPDAHRRTDTEIAQAVRATLEWDARVPHERIRTDVTDGVVTLRGTVEYWSQHEDAARSIRNLNGVREVKNLITVDPSSSVTSPQRVRASIEKALARHGKHHDEHVRIAIADGCVTLTGDLPSRAERFAVEVAALSTPGVRAVDNLIQVHD